MGGLVRECEDMMDDEAEMEGTTKKDVISNYKNYVAVLYADSLDTRFKKVKESVAVGGASGAACWVLQKAVESAQNVSPTIAVAVGAVSTGACIVANILRRHSLKKQYIELSQMEQEANEEEEEYGFAETEHDIMYG